MYIGANFIKKKKKLKNLYSVDMVALRKLYHSFCRLDMLLSLGSTSEIHAKNEKITVYIIFTNFVKVYTGLKEKTKIGQHSQGRLAVILA